jgi:hypothetical protein
MLLNFQQRFEAPILAGTKRQTIRRARKDDYRPAVGSVLHLYVHARTSKMRKIAEKNCEACHTIVVDFTAPRAERLLIDSFPLEQYWPHLDQNAFARADGFNDLAEMREFFEGLYGADEFTGNLITW